jgi:anti-anti-sigma factor
MPQLSLELTGAPERPVLQLSGELDLATVDDFRDAAKAGLAGAGSLALDLEQVDFVDSSGLGALVDLANLARSQGGSLTIVEASRAARRVIEIAGLGAILGLSS